MANKVALCENVVDVGRFIVAFLLWGVHNKPTFRGAAMGLGMMTNATRVISNFFGGRGCERNHGSVQTSMSDQYNCPTT